MKTKSLTLIICVVSTLFLTEAIGQISINSDGSAPDASAGLDIYYTNKGLLLPRITTVQRNAISFPAEGLLIFNLTTGCIDYYLGGSWKSFCGVSEPIFQCGMKMTDSRDGKLYNTLKIGTQCWMAQNLNTGTKVDGSVEQSDNSNIEKYCYNNLESNCAIYGGLYQWDEMMQYVTTEGVMGICPSGWHLPSNAELSMLTEYLEGESVAGGKMKEAGLTHWASPNSGATNESGFSGLPGGYRYGNGDFNNLSVNAFFWSSSQYDATTKCILLLYYNTENVGRPTYDKTDGMSARCIQD